jgi:hypothetical protein
MVKNHVASHAVMFTFYKIQYFYKIFIVLYSRVKSGMLFVKAFSLYDGFSTLLCLRPLRSVPEDAGIQQTF